MAFATDVPSFDGRKLINQPRCVLRCYAILVTKAIQNVSLGTGNVVSTVCSFTSRT